MSEAENQNQPAQPRIFLFLQLRIDDEILRRTKIRELRGLRSLLSDLLEDILARPLPSGLPLKDLVFEYIDANSRQVLVSMRAEAEGLKVSGQIPKGYQPRMLYEPDAELVLSAENASVFNHQPATSLIERIREAIGEDERFEFILWT
jgi:hypothetical protein